MQEIHPEMLPTAPAAAAAIAVIADINRDFLRLLVHPATRKHGELLGLQQPLLDGLRRLDSDQLNRVADVPVLLAEFATLRAPAGVAGVADEGYAAAQIADDWLQELRSFADRLLTCIWQATQHDDLMAAFCIGCNTDKRAALAELNFAAIRRLSGRSAHSLRVRLATHPYVWGDLIRSVRSGNSTQQMVAQLAVIQLSLAPRWSDGARGCTIARHASALPT
jgi:hypothetical protein